MPERRIVASINPDSKDPTFTLAYVFSKRMPGVVLDNQPPHEDNLYHGALQLMVKV